MGVFNFRRKGKMGNTEKFSFRVVIEFGSDDRKEVNKITKEDAQKCYDSIKASILKGDKFVELPEMDCLDDDDDVIRFLPEFISIANVERVYIDLEEE